tara:strand:+ start:233 stop:544 length:312 start_codon:yes stop_codon:yes gene_type:complete
MNTKPLASSPIPNQNTIGKAKADIKLVPVWAPIILKPVRLVLCSLSSVILGVKEEKGTLTIVKHVLCSKFANKRNIKRAVPSKGGAHIRRTNERAKGMFPNNR